MAGAHINNPCVNLIEFETTVYSKEVYSGLMHIESLKGSPAELFPAERKNNGDYASLENLIKRVPVII